MDKIKNFFAHGIGRIIKWAFFILLAAYIALVIVRVFQMFAADKTEAQVAKIHATKLELSDVMGDNLPPDPGALADETLAGVDANENGIRDDVELAIFEKYPNSAKTRAVLLQYALALQMEFTQPIVNKATVTAVAEETSRGYSCIGEVVPRDDMDKFSQITDEYIYFIEKNHLNTEQRKSAQKEFYNDNLRSFELQDGCDINFEDLPN